MFEFLKRGPEIRLGNEKYICPYCFERFDKYAFQCSNNRCEGKATGASNDKVFAAPNKDSAVCPDCKQNTFKKVCPKCYQELPESTLDHEDCIISIVGSRASGKSHFVGVLIHEMINRIAPGMSHGAFEGFADSYTRYMTNFADKIYQGQALPLSQRAEVNDAVAKPYIFKYRFQDPKKKKVRCYTFVFFDTAGEDLRDDDNMSTVNKYICESSGIIFLLDPMNIQGVVNSFDKDWVMRASGGVSEYEGAAYEIIIRVSKLIRNNKKLKANQKIDIPVAAVFSKYDAFESLVPDGSRVKQASPHVKVGKFVEEDRVAVNREIETLLQDKGATAFTSLLENNYSTYSYFAVSSLGLDNNPSSNRFDIPHPHRIEDPLLWLMKIGGKLV